MIRACAHTRKCKNDLIHSSLFFTGVYFKRFADARFKLKFGNTEWNICKTGDFSAENYSQHQETYLTSFQLNHVSEPKLSLYDEFQSCRESYFSNECCQKHVSR